MSRQKQVQKRQNQKSRRGKTRSRGMTMVNGGPFPPTKTVVLRYSDVSLIAEGGAAPAGGLQVYRLSDVYGPNYTNVGNHALYFNQLCTSNGPYLTFAVLSATIRLRFVNNSTTIPAVLSVYPAMYTAAAADQSTACERPYGWTRMLAPLGSGAATVETTLKFDNVKYSGVPYATFLTQFGGNFGSPAGGPVLHLQAWGQGGNATINVEVQIDYTTRFNQLGPETH